MAEILPNEALDYLLARVPKGSASPTTLYLGLFVSQTADTVPADDAVLATETGVTEADYPGYSRVSIPAADWGSPDDVTIEGTAGRGVSASQKSFPAATGEDAAPINGFFVASASTGGVALGYANFDDETAVPGLSLGDVVKVTPTFGLAG